MNLKLTRPLCVFDLESTGLDISKDRIVEISVLKIFPNGNKESKTWLVNPEIPIPKITSDIHGITDEKIKDEPTFKDLLPKVNEMIKGCDLAGFNSNRFDIPLLAEEFLRNDFDFDMNGRYAVDVQNIFHKMEKRTLSAAYMFYCDKDLENAHSAEADTLATFEILDSQISRYPELENSVKHLSEFSSYRKTVDLAGFIAMNENEEEVFTFGKNKNVRVIDVLKSNPGYYSWMQKSDFPSYTKKILTKIRLKTMAI